MFSINATIALYGREIIDTRYCLGVKQLVEQDIKMLNECEGSHIIEMNVQQDHANIVVSIPPKVAVSTLMGDVKRCACDQTI
jgi:REP element-mobilizing transposase RayT